MWQFIEDGGFTMFPLLAAGFCLTGVSVLYATRPTERLRGTAFNLGVVVLFAGLFGGAQAVRTVLRVAASAEDADAQHRIVLAGLSESANNLVLAFFFLSLAAVLVTAGAWREQRAL